VTRLLSRMRSYGRQRKTLIEGRSCMLAGDMPKQVVPVPPRVAAGSMIANTRDGTVDPPATAGGADRIQQGILI